MHLNYSIQWNWIAQNANVVTTQARHYFAQFSRIYLFLFVFLQQINVCELKNLS